VTADLLSNGISVLVEKPLATTVGDANDLCKLVNGSSAHLQVGHLERCNTACLEAVKRGKQARYIRMERSGPFPGRGGDVDVVLELMTHDLDILLQLTSGEVQSISASGWSVLTPHLDLAAARILFTDGLVADLHASRISSERSRRFSVLDQLGALEVDLAARSITRISPDGSGRAHGQQVLQSEDPLLDQDRAFVEALHNGHQPLVGAEAGRAAVVLATRILDCIRTGSASC
jgi:predicted dehydrogenase